MSHSIYSDGHFSTTIGWLLYSSVMGSFCWSVRLSPVTPCPPQLLQLVQYSSSMWQWSRACVVFCSWIQSCGMRCCEVWPCVVSSAVFVSSENDFKEHSLCIRLFQIGKIGAETFQMLTFAFREEVVRQTVVFDCSAESRNEMNLSRMLNIQGACLPAECTEVPNLFMGFGMKVDVLPSTSWLMIWAAFWFMPSILTP